MNLIRRLTEILLGPVIVRRRLPAIHGGGMIVTSARVGGLKYLFRSAEHWDAQLLNVAQRLVRKGQIVWDVGANAGLFSKAAAYRAGSEGSVLSIEADLDAVKLLNKTCLHRLPGHAAMTVLPVAIGESVGIVRFSISKRARASNSIEGYGSSQTGGVAEVRTLPSVTLDHLLKHFAYPQVVKIDVEGAELTVLRGGERLLQDIRPVVYCEVATTTRDAVTSLLNDNDYKLWDGRGFSGTSTPGITQCAHNTVAVPKEKIDSYVDQNA